MPIAHGDSSSLSLKFSVKGTLISCRVRCRLWFVLWKPVCDHELVVHNTPSLDKLLLDERQDLLGRVYDEYLLLQSYIRKNSFYHKNSFHVNIYDLIEESSALLLRLAFYIWDQDDNLLCKILCEDGVSPETITVVGHS